jgi:hypothetical protein
MLASEVLLAGRCRGRFRYRRSVIFCRRVRDEEIPYWDEEIPYWVVGAAAVGAPLVALG